MIDSLALSFFYGVARDYRMPRVSIVIVTHVLPDRPTFLRALSTIADVEVIIPKPKSIHSETLAEIEQQYQVLSLTRDQFADVEFVQSSLSSVSGEFVILDIGGYFAPCINELHERLEGQMLGVVEDTENGHQRYARLPGLSCPVVSVARSPLKRPEDLLVGESIVFSTDSVLRTDNMLMNNRSAGILGYGNIGQSIAFFLSSRTIQTSIYDTDPIRRIQAMARGLRVPSKQSVLSSSDILFCASGNMSLGQHDYHHIKHGCIVASVTSSDDEFDRDRLDQMYSKERLNKDIVRYYNDHNYFYILNDGNAINFLHNAVVGNYIYLIQSELMEGVHALAKRQVASGLHDLPDEARRRLADEWLRTFAWT